MRLGPKLATQAREIIGQATLNRLMRADGHVKLLCDYPIEWTEIDGLPLGVPGNLFLAETLNRQQMSVSRAALRDGVVTRAYQVDTRDCMPYFPSAHCLVRCWTPCATRQPRVCIAA